MGTESPAEVLERLDAAMNKHDLAGFVSCFDPDYESDQPAHPDRKFRGRDQVERNWSAMFSGLPDFQSAISRRSITSDSFWVEWRWTGSRSDSTKLDVRGICVFGVRDGLITWGRLYMEDTQIGEGIEAAVSSLAAAQSPDARRTLPTR